MRWRQQERGEHGPVRYLVGNGQALCAEGEAIMESAPQPEEQKSREYRKAYWSCGHGAKVMKPLWPPVCMLMDVGLEKRQRRHIVGVKLCFECWESVRERWESVKEAVPAEWKQAANGAPALTDGRKEKAG
jgi:hypothetical protein